MNRRAFVAFSALAPAVTALRSFAQAPSGNKRIGFLYWGSRQSAIASGRYKAFIDGMRVHGYVLGKNFTLEEHFAEGSADALAGAAKELAALKVDAIVATGNQAVEAAQKATGAIPIVCTAASDPVGQGFASSLARPGGNVTGLYTSTVELVGKQLEVLELLLPKLSRLAVLSNPGNSAHLLMLKSIQAFEAKSGVSGQTLRARTPADIELAFGTMARERAQAVVILADTFFLQQAPQISQLAVKHGLPTLSWTREFTEAGGLMSYGQDLNDNFRLAADYLDKIFKGAKAAELPFSRSPRIRLTLNRRTFKALGLALPRELEIRADEVIE